jgi:hypothetical protein
MLGHGKTQLHRGRPPRAYTSAEGADGCGQSTAFCSCPRARKCIRPGAPKLVDIGPKGAAPGALARATKHKPQHGHTHDVDLTSLHSTCRLTACAHGRRPDTIGLFPSLMGSSARASGARAARGWQVAAKPAGQLEPISLVFASATVVCGGNSSSQVTASANMNLIL